MKDTPISEPCLGLGEFPFEVGRASAAELGHRARGVLSSPRWSLKAGRGSFHRAGSWSASTAATRGCAWFSLRFVAGVSTSRERSWPINDRSRTVKFGLPTTPRSIRFLQPLARTQGSLKPFRSGLSAALLVAMAGVEESKSEEPLSSAPPSTRPSESDVRKFCVQQLAESACNNMIERSSWRGAAVIIFSA